MKRCLFFIPLWVCLSGTKAQPYVDPLQVRYTHGGRTGQSDRATPFNHLWIGSDLPLRLRENSYLLLSPYFERWQFDSGSYHHIVPPVKSMALPVGLMLPLKNPRWSVVVNGILRSNGEQLFMRNGWQTGMAGFFSFARRPNQKFRFGVYVNTEFFGLFVMPLLGADWKMSAKDYLFGLLPGRLTWEHRLGEKFFTGLTFRALTNSFRQANGNYLRLDDNQLSAYLDLYPAKKWAVSLEGGYGLLRKMRIGEEKRKYQLNDHWGDGWFLRLSSSYRIRFK